MLTGENKGKIDKVWNTFWSGGISDPLRVIEQISFLLFIKRLDDLHTAREKQANRLGKPIKEPIFAVGRWQVLNQKRYASLCAFAPLISAPVKSRAGGTV